MKICVKKVGENLTVQHIKSYSPDVTLRSLQGIVNGYIESVNYNGIDGVLIICNEEGNLKGLKPNFFNGNQIIVGDVAFVRSGKEDFEELTDKQIDTLLKRFATRPSKKREGDKK